MSEIYLLVRQESTYESGSYVTPLAAYEDRSDAEIVAARLNEVRSSTYKRLVNAEISYEAADAALVDAGDPTGKYDCDGYDVLPLGLIQTMGRRK